VGPECVCGLSIGTKYLGIERLTSTEMYLVDADARTAMLFNRNLKTYI